MSRMGQSQTPDTSSSVQSLTNQGRTFECGALGPVFTSKNAVYTTNQPANTNATTVAPPQVTKYAISIVIH